MVVGGRGVLQNKTFRHYHEIQVTCVDLAVCTSHRTQSCLWERNSLLEWLWDSAGIPLWYPGATFNTVSSRCQLCLSIPSRAASTNRTHKGRYTRDCLSGSQRALLKFEQFVIHKARRQSRLGGANRMICRAKQAMSSELKIGITKHYV